MKDLNLYITEKFKINKNTISSNKDAILEGTIILRCRLFDPANGGKHSFYTEKIETVTNDDITLKGRITKYKKNKNWIGTGGWQHAYAYTGSYGSNNKEDINKVKRTIINKLIELGWCNNG